MVLEGIEALVREFAPRAHRAAVAAPGPTRPDGRRAAVRSSSNAVGNRAISHDLTAGRRSLSVGATHDPAEAEADAMARRVVTALQAGGPGGAVPPPIAPSAAPVVRRRASFPDGSAPLDGADHDLLARAGRAGRPLEPSVRQRFESAFGGADLSRVRLHAGPQATALNDRLSSEACTVGRDIFFQRGLPDVATRGGQDLLAHELTHTLQQGDGGLLVQRKGKRNVTPRTPPTNVDLIDGWVTYSSVKGKPRSKELKGIDKAVAAWAKSGKKKAGMLDLNEVELLAIRSAIGRWRSSKQDTSMRELMVQALEVRVADELRSITTRREDRVEQQRRNEQWGRFGGGIGAYAVRNGKEAPAKDSMWAGLLERGEDGLITDESLQKMQRHHGQEMLEMVRRQDQGSGPERGVNREAAATSLESETSALRDKYAGTSSEADQLRSGRSKGEMVEEERDLAGFRVRITRDSNDAIGAEKRIVVLEKALALIGERLDARPAFHLYLPMFGTRITPGAKDNEVVVHKDLARAEFYFPDLLLLTPIALDSTVDTSISSQLYAKAMEDNEYEAKRGVASSVHEMGHLLHFKLNPKHFVDCNKSNLKGEIAQLATEGVSKYASTNPKELIAEMFTGMIYGRTYPEPLMEAYRALGGPALKER